MEPDYKAIGLRIRAERLRRNLSQERLAELAALSTTHMSHVETGHTKVSLPSLLSIANVLGVTVDELLADSLANGRHLFENEILRETEDCSEEEIRIIADMAHALKLSLRRRQQNQGSTE